ncbi:MAG: hypothetical protein N2Z79_03480, partial [Candidatus Omnitrophica bacterium]|nr:hypothetical protein [Candidatus Omnitrophota bacterium]
VEFIGKGPQATLEKLREISDNLLIKNRGFSSQTEPQLGNLYKLTGFILGASIGIYFGLPALQAGIISLGALLFGWIIHEFGHKLGRPYDKNTEIRAGPLASLILLGISSLTTVIFLLNGLYFTSLPVITTLVAVGNYLIHIFADNFVLGRDALQLLQNIRRALSTLFRGWWRQSLSAVAELGKEDKICINYKILKSLAFYLSKNVSLLLQNILIGSTNMNFLWNPTVKLWERIRKVFGWSSAKIWLGLLKKNYTRCLVKKNYLAFDSIGEYRITGFIPTGRERFNRENGLAVAKNSWYYQVYTWASVGNKLKRPIAWFIALVLAPVLEPLIFFTRPGGFKKFFASHSTKRNSDIFENKVINWFLGLDRALNEKNNILRWLYWTLAYPRAVILHFWHNFIILLSRAPPHQLAIAGNEVYLGLEELICI